MDQRQKGIVRGIDGGPMQGGSASHAPTLFAIGALSLSLLALLPTSCGSSNSGANNPDMATQQCFDNPTTHVQIINACTTAISIDKPATQPKLQAGAPLQPPP
jgi:hypothetical protein